MKIRIQTIATITTVLGLAAGTLQAAPQTFDFTDPKGVNNIRFQLDAPLESISGTSTGVSGEVRFDVSAPDQTSGRIVIDASTLTVGNPVMREHLHSADWLNVAENASIVFEVIEVAETRSIDDSIEAKVKGRLSLNGITREITVPVRFTHLPDLLGARLGDDSVKGDLLVLRADFEVNRSDFGIQAGEMTDRVAETIEISLALAGAAPKA